MGTPEGLDSLSKLLHKYYLLIHYYGDGARMVLIVALHYLTKGL